MTVRVSKNDMSCIEVNENTLVYMYLSYNNIFNYIDQLKYDNT